MLLDLVDNSKNWKAYAMAHYGLLIKSTTVELIEEPVLVGVYSKHPERVAMKFKIAPRVGSVEKPAIATEVGSVQKPAIATEVWNIQSPSSANFGYLGLQARREMFQTISEGASRSIAGGDLNMTRFQTEAFNKSLESQQRWKVYEPVEARHGDLFLTRNVKTVPMHMTIGRSYVGDPAHKSSDAHNACGLVLFSTVQVVPSPAAATSVPKPGPTTSSVSTVAMHEFFEVSSEDAMEMIQEAHDARARELEAEPLEARAEGSWVGSACSSVAKPAAAHSEV
jgi:hypothetical protein